VTTLLVRQLSSTESSTTITLWQSVLMTGFALLPLPFFWVTPSWGGFGMLLAMGLIGGVAQILLTEAYASAQVSSLGPYSYAALLWSALLGFLFWGVVPGPAMLLGSLLIVIAGLYILHREMVLRRRRAEAERATT
jgi:drug/metabolite transporter (DMT)-like permease